MNETYNQKLVFNSRNLRKNMTKEERHLWYDCLKQLNITAHRQKVIGPYIVDFYIASAKLVIEVDGSQHYEESGMATDAVRDEYLKKLGISVLRYSNADVNYRFNAVCEDIWNRVQKPSPQGEALVQKPSPGGEGARRADEV